jgi:hypothetical protein
MERRHPLFYLVSETSKENQSKALGNSLYWELVEIRARIGATVRCLKSITLN